MQSCLKSLSFVTAIFLKDCNNYTICIMSQPNGLHKRLVPSHQWNDDGEQSYADEQHREDEEMKSNVAKKANWLQKTLMKWIEMFMVLPANWIRETLIKWTEMFMKALLPILLVGIAMCLSILVGLPERESSLVEIVLIGICIGILVNMILITLMGKSDRTHDMFHRSCKFGKNPSGILTRFLSTIEQVADSVGIIWCGDLYATCWMLGKDTIITCKHFAEDVREHREKNGSSFYQRVFVDFDFTKKRSENPREIDENRGFIAGDDLDYLICYLQPISNSETVGPAPLGDLTRAPLPLNGSVILIGHPGAFPKQFEVCPILSHDCREQVVRGRAQEAQNYCLNNPWHCGMCSPFRLCGQCVHAHGEETLEMIRRYRLGYDTSFYYGSSGSPVLNDCGHIIAMHLGGHTYQKGSKMESLMEFALPISAIYEDVKNKEGEQKAKEWFPSCC